MTAQIVVTLRSEKLPVATLTDQVRKALSMVTVLDPSLAVSVNLTRGEKILTLDRVMRTVQTPQRRVLISEKQETLLHLLASDRRSWTASELSVRITADALDHADHVRSLVHRTRRTLGVNPIETLRGVGYRWNPTYALLEA